MVHPQLTHIISQLLKHIDPLYLHILILFILLHSVQLRSELLALDDYV
jgi:hypothetical protein